MENRCHSSQPVRIAGSGPAGLTAALTLAHAGFGVEVFEKRPDGGRRFGGDLQGLENWSMEIDVVEHLRSLGLAINFDCTPFTELTVTNGERLWHFDSQRPLFYLVKRGAVRGSLDWGLKEQALEAGVVIRYGEALPPAAADIVATGPRAAERFAIDKGIVFRTTMADGAYGLVNDEAAFRGYAYLLVVNGYGCMCTVLFDAFRRARRCLAETERLFARLLPLDIRDPRPAGGIGSFALPGRFLRGGSRFAGEAAGLQDLLWGFGMRSAVLSGHLAARSIIDGSDYGRTAARLFGRRLKASLVNRFLWEALGRDRYLRIMDRLHGAPDPHAFLRSFHNLNWLQRLLYPLARCRLRRRYPWLAGGRGKG